MPKWITIHVRPPPEHTINIRDSLYNCSTLQVSKDLQTSCITSVPLREMTRTAEKEGTSTKPSFPLPQEIIENPEMFEEAWLSHQEASIEQLANGLFRTASERSSPKVKQAKDSARPLHDLYQRPKFVLIHRRLQASLLHGTLCPPTESFPELSRLTYDVGLRQRFSAFWLRTYDFSTLKSAAQIVIGHSMEALRSAGTENDRNLSSEGKKDRVRKQTIGERILKSFLEACLVRNEDASEAQRMSSAIWCWQRTMLRSIMLILLLDQAKETGLIRCSLFRPKSKLKSSSQVITELASLISPSVGDLGRLLTRLRCTVQHVQRPLSEYQYRIKSLALDMRDGVRLTRIVELLIYHSTILSSVREDLTNDMQTDLVLTWEGHEKITWPLSQHLILPCSGRAQRLHNVQVALGALSGVRDFSALLQDLTADHIVDGHREKTVSLLYNLIGRWGLESLVNFEDLERENQRLGKALPASVFVVHDGEDRKAISNTRHVSQLKE